MKKTSDLTFCGLISSVSVIFLVLACTFGGFSMIVNAVCGSFIYIISLKIGKKAGFMSYITVCLTAVFFVFKISTLYMYIFFCGIYPIFKVFIDGLKNKIFMFFFKMFTLFVFYLFFVCFLFISMELLNMNYILRAGYRHLFVNYFFSFTLYFFIYDYFLIFFVDRYFGLVGDKILKNS